MYIFQLGNASSNSFQLHYVQKFVNLNNGGGETVAFPRHAHACKLNFLILRLDFFFRRTTLLIIKIEIRGRPATERSERHDFLFRKRISKLMNQISNTVGALSRWDPVRSTRTERKPIGSRSPYYDPVNGLLNPLHRQSLRFRLRCIRSGGPVGLRRLASRSYEEKSIPCAGWGSGGGGSDQT